MDSFPKQTLTILTELTTITFHPDGHLLAAGAVDGTIKLYDVKTSQLALSLIHI